MFQKLKQYKDMREQAKDIHSKLAQESVEGTAGFNKVKINMNGAQEVTGVVIDESLCAPTEKKHLEGLVKDAINDAIKKGHRVMAEKMKGMGDLKLPGMHTSS